MPVESLLSGCSRSNSGIHKVVRLARASRNTILSRRLLAVLAAAFCLTTSDLSWAQTSQRSFQLSQWVYRGGTTPTSSDTDVQSFYDGEAQPAGLSILIFENWATNTTMASMNLDWS